MSIPNLKLAKAENAVMSHDWKTAARLYKELLVGNESNVDYLKALASIYVKSGEDEKAIPYYEQIINFYPHDVDAMNSLGAIYRRLGKYEESITVLQRALEERVNIGSVNYNLGFTYKEMGNYEDAIDAFELVISENPSDVLAYNHLGSIFFAMQEYHKSIMTFKKGLQVDPNHPILNYNLARCYEADKSPSEAIRCYEAALKTRPGWIDAIRDYSELLINCQETTHAQEMVEQSIKLHPMDTDLLSLLGKIYLHQNDYERSISAYEKAEDIKGDDANILTGLANALEKSSKVDQALDKIEQAVDLEPDNKDVRKQYAHTLLSAQRYDQALDNINELYNDKGDKDLQILDLYGQYFICRGKEEAAKFYYDKIKRISNHYKDFMLEAADRFMQTGDYERAEKYAKDYIQYRPQRPDGYTHLGKVYNAQGRIKDAQGQYEKSISLKKPNIFANKEIERIRKEIEAHPEKYRTPDVAPKEPEVIVQNENEEKESLEDFQESVIKPEPEESFDFTKMGDDFSTEELLKDDEDDFWNSFDDEDETSSNALEKTLVEDDEAFVESEDHIEEIGDDDKEQESFFDLGDAGYLPKNEAFPDEVFPDEVYSDQVADDADSTYYPEQEYNIPSLKEQAMEAAFNAQKMVQEVAEKQQQLEDEIRKENEDLIRETVEKTIDDRLEAAAGYNEEFGDLGNIPDDVYDLPEDGFQIPEPEVVDEEEQVIPIKAMELFDEEDPIYILDNDDGIAAEKAAEYLNNPTEKNIDERLQELGQAEDTDDILEKIEKILSNPELALEYKEQIELFKTLRILSKFLPESERNKFLTCRMRVLIEYIIAKMSGKPGLLITAESLLKSGVLGPEYEQHIFDYDPNPLSDELVKKVLVIMKDLARKLEDKELVNSLIINIDAILEKIELAKQESDIF